MIALVGNQNSGKTTLFNLLTGSNQKIGNWPGVTLEKKVGMIKNTQCRIVDLPGIYSLNSYSDEEKISRNYLLSEKPSKIINIIDVTQLERSLYLTMQLIELNIPMVIALNMQDIALKNGIKIDVIKLSEILNRPVIEISASKNKGVDELLDLTCMIDEGDLKQISYFDSTLLKTINQIENQIDHPSKRFLATKILEGDLDLDIFNESEIGDLKLKVTSFYNMELDELISTERYNFISEIKKEIVSYDDSFYKPTITNKLDKIFLNRFFAIPIFILIMAGIYFLTAGVVGALTVELMESLFESLSSWTAKSLTSVGASPWSVSLVVDGVIGGVGAILGFVPQLLILFLLISFLEASGYMSRIAFSLDAIFRKVGLSGKSIIPFILGIGCSVPSIMATKTIDDEQEKEMTIYLAPFIPCNAKLPIIALFAGYFFPNYRGVVTVGFYFMSIVVIFTMSLILKKIAFKKESTGYISELPTYKLPSIKYVAKDVWYKVWSFIKRAGTIILLSSIIIWFLASITWGFIYTDNPGESILKTIGEIVSPLFYPILGTRNWGASVAAIQGLVAKENVVSTIEVILGLSNQTITDLFTPLNAFTFMTFNLFSAPCFGAIGAMRDAFGSRKKMWYAVLLQTGFAWVISSLIFGIVTLIGVIF